MVSSAALALDAGLGIPVMPDNKGVHWSYYVLSASAAAGAVVAFSAYVLSVPIIALSGLAVAVSNGIGSHYVKKFSNLGMLEDYVAVLKNKINGLASEILNLRRTNRELKTITDDLEQERIAWGETIRNGEERIRHEGKRIEELTKNLEKMQDKYEKMGQLIKGNIQKATDSIASGALLMFKDEELLGAGLKDLQTTVLSHQISVTKLTDEVKELDVQTDQYDAVNKAFFSQIKFLSNLFEVMQKVMNEVKFKMEALEKERTQLSEIVPRAENSAEVVSKQVEKMTQLKENLEKRLLELSKKIEDFTRWKESDEKKQYDEYKTLVQSSEYKDFLKWRKKHDKPKHHHH